MAIGERIKQARELYGMSQTELADKLQIKKQTLFKYENGIITNIPSDKIEMIGKILSVSPAYLMGWEDNLTIDNANLIPDIMKDKELLKNIRMLSELNKEHKDKIYNDISYWYSKEGH